MNERSARSWRTIYPWRARAETYVTGPMLALVLLQGTAVADTVTSGYWMAAVAKASLMFFILVPICAVCAAWQGARRRGGGVDEPGIPRPVWVVAAVAVAPTLVMGVVGLGEVAPTLPATVTSDVGAADTKQSNAAEAVVVGLPAEPDPQIVVMSPATSVVPEQPPPCAAHEPWPGAHHHAALTVWVALAAGVPASTLDSAAPPEPIDLVVRVRQQLDNEQQLAWYPANPVSMGDCTTQPRPDPASFASEQPR